MTLNIDKEYPGDVEFDYETIARQVVEAALDSENCPYEAEVSLVLTTDEDIQRTNREFREIDRVTDVPVSYTHLSLRRSMQPNRILSALQGISLTVISQHLRILRYYRNCFVRSKRPMGCMPVLEIMMQEQDMRKCWIFWTRPGLSLIHI